MLKFLKYKFLYKFFMTRINVIPVKELENMHLLAEYRELPRIFQLSKKAYEDKRKVKAPKFHTLGKGHDC